MEPEITAAPRMSVAQAEAAEAAAHTLLAEVLAPLPAWAAITIEAAASGLAKAVARRAVAERIASGAPAASLN